MVFLYMGSHLQRHTGDAAPLPEAVSVTQESDFTVTPCGRTSLTSNGMHCFSDQRGHEHFGVMELHAEP